MKLQHVTTQAHSARSFWREDVASISKAQQQLKIGRHSHMKHTNQQRFHYLKWGVSFLFQPLPARNLCPCRGSSLQQLNSRLHQNLPRYLYKNSEERESALGRLRGTMLMSASLWQSTRYMKKKRHCCTKKKRSTPLHLWPTWTTCHNE